MSKNEKEIIVVAETGFDVEGEQYINIEKAETMEESREAFIAKLKSFLGVEDYDEPSEPDESDDESDDDDDDWADDRESFEDEYKDQIDAGKYVDYNENYLLQIKVI